MALKFGNATGGSSGKKVDAYQMRDGENVVRLFGDIMPRYLFWVPNPKGTPKELPVEALQFQRDTESWDNSQKEPVKEQYPDLKPKWSYSCLGFDADGNIKAFNFKKTLFNHIKDAAETLGDPTDPETGWDIVFKKRKTGPSPLNVEYTLDSLKSQKRVRPLTDEEREKIAAFATIDEIYPRPTEEQVRQNLANIMSSGNDEEVDEEATKEFEIQ